MRRYLQTLLVLALAATFVQSAEAQRHRDPLNDAEVDQLRESAQEPMQRMKLLVKFARARMGLVDQMRANPALIGKDSTGMRDALEDLASLVDEVDNNLDMFNNRSEDLRKPLKLVVEMDSDFQLKLRALKESSSAEQLRAYGFALDNAIDSVNESADSARAMLEDQLAKRGKPKEGKDKDEDDSKDRKPPKGHQD